ncbi:MAG: hypothetical protein E7644_05330 [Ruminococcaceae bacterium]|nr:hypothetical protein [Oscillospiraceae bacterium]
MKEIVQHSIYGEIVYNESFWTGKKALTINGVDAKPISKKEYMVNEKRAILKGSFLTGSTLLIEGETIQLSPKAKWNEIILAIIPFLFLLTWGNSPSLCSIFPVVGGAIGGALGGVGAVISLFLMKTQKNPIVKTVVGIIVAVATILIAFVLALAILSFA